MALLIVLWITVSAALIVSAFNATVRSGLSFVGSEVEEAQLEALLNAGTEIAAARLIDQDEGRLWQPDGSRHTVSFAGARITIGIRDANALVDLNKADPKLLLGLLRRFADSEKTAKRLRDLILQARALAAGKDRSTGPRDDHHTERDSIAEAQLVGADAVPAFVDVAQLRDIAGVTPELYRALVPYLTVYGREGLINPSFAPDEVLAAVPGLTRTDIKNLRVQARANAKVGADAALLDIAQRAGAYLSDTPGPAFIVTVEIRRSKRSAARVAVLVPTLDAQAPYRMIAKYPIGPIPTSGRTGVIR